MLEEKDPDVDAEYGINFEDELVTLVQPRTFYEAGEIVAFAQDTGFYYQVSLAGKTSRNFPEALPRESGETVSFGSCVLTCKHPSEVSPATISDASWSLPSGLTLASQRTQGFVAFATLSGGVDGTDYEVTCRLTPSVGNAIDKTITIQVRSQ